LRVKAVGA